MILNVGYNFSKATKTWMACFLFNSMAVAGAAANSSVDREHLADAMMAEQPAAHYETLSLEDIEKREAQALKDGDMQAYAAYEIARDALVDTQEGRRATPADLPEDYEDKLYTRDNQGVAYKVIDPARDIDWTEFFLAQKTARVTAEFVEPGTEVETVMANGLVETKKTAGPDGGYRVKNPTGEQYLVDKAKFESIYQETDKPGVFKPVPDPRKVVRVDRNVAFKAPWGADMHIRENGALVHEKVKTIYGIQPDEYDKTYGTVEPA